MKKNLFYIISLIILMFAFSFSYFIGVKFKEDKKNIANEITEEDLLETIRLNLDYGWHHYFGWQNRKYNGMEIICSNNDKVFFSIELNQDYEDSVKNADSNYFTDYSVLYMEITKKNGYYFRSQFFGDDMEEVDKERFCE